MKITKELIEAALVEADADCLNAADLYSAAELAVIDLESMLSVAKAKREELRIKLSNAHTRQNLLESLLKYYKD